MLRVAPAIAGRFVSAELRPDSAPRDASLAARAAALFRYTDEYHQTGVGPVETAPDLRPGGK